MKSDMMHASAQVDQFILNNLVEVKETIATGIGSARNAKSFGLQDLWNIRRKAKFASDRMRKF
ncbi:MAG: hypothetical protein ABI415_11695 [Flavitalea sp.]